MNETTQSLSPLLPGPKVILMGDSGTGKTHSLRTLIDAGITPFCFFLEQGREVLGDLPKDKWHWKYIRPFNASWAQLNSLNKNILTLDYENLTKTKDAFRRECVGFMDVVTSCNNFKCDCHGIDFGDTINWKTDRALCFDGLSGLSTLAMTQTTGVKATRGQNEWGVAMNTVNFLLEKLVSDLTCMLVVLAHEERETDLATGGAKIMVKTLGQKLAPDIPRKFSDVIQVNRIGAQFSWDPIAPNAATKTRYLELKSGQPASFVPLINGWKKKGGVIVPS